MTIQKPGVASRVAIAGVCVGIGVLSVADFRPRDLMTVQAILAAAFVGAIAEVVASATAGAIGRVSRWPVMVACSRILALWAVYATVLPTIDLRWSLGCGTSGSTVVGAVWATAVHASAVAGFSVLRSKGLRQGTKPVAALAGLWILGLLAKGGAIAWSQPTSIEAFLEELTPLGSPELAVQQTLESYGLRSDFMPVRVAAGSTYPPAALGGESWRRALVSEYRFIVVTSVEAYYYFDGDGRLREVRVRKTTDSL